MSESAVRYYDGWAVVPGREVVEAVAKGSRRYAKVIAAVPGRSRRTEMYADGALNRVEFDGLVDSIPGVPFTVRREAGDAAEFHWSVLRLYRAEGVLRSVVVQLLDSLDRSLMSVEYSPSGDVIETSKATFGPGGTVQYVFTYDETGELYEVYDSPEGRSVGIDDALRVVADRDFYADGRALPVALVHISSEFPEHIFHEEAAWPDPVAGLRK